ncbi:MAG: TonB-dependent receptor [Acidobacteria bacterium]|nr:MAG: TonB-dependent receptor [Acidobacteriota bacterium]
MNRKKILALTLELLLLAVSIPALCQVSTVNGSLAGTVYDTSGAVIPSAKVTIVGPTGSRATYTDSNGNFIFRVLPPGSYQTSVEKSGFKAYKISGAQVNVNQVTTIHVTLVVGAATQSIEVTTPAIRVDTSSTNVTTAVSDTVYAKLPLGRNVSSLFYMAPGVANGIGAGPANPSISGGSGLENLYVADGVNITDSGFGGLGTFAREYGSLGTGINMAFVKEVDIKTGGFEPQYGKATGGIVQIVTKSGTDKYHGSITGYFQPKDFEATRLQPDDFGLVTKYGKALHPEGFDVAGELGGPVPKVSNHLFFFGSFDPTWNRIYSLAPPASALFQHGPYTLRTNTYNYASKMTYKINDKHQVNFSFFGDPSHTGNSPWRSLTADNNTRFTTLTYGTRDLVARYSGMLSPTWLISGSFTWDHNTFTETPASNLNEIIDDTQTDGLPGQRGEFTPVGLGYLENTIADTYDFDVSTTKTVSFAGSHAISIGYHFEIPHFNGTRDYSGPLSPIPATNAAGDPLTSFGVDPSLIGTQVSAQYILLLAPSSCTLCPLMNIPGYSSLQPVYLRQRRGIFGTTAFNTHAKYHAAYIEDVWKMNKNLTLDLGMRYEQQRLIGNVVQYSLTDNWLPRIGVTFDPIGDRKTKIYANFGRYDYVLPLDVAERSLSTENDFYSSRLAPDYVVNGNGQRTVTINQYGTVTPILDAAHTLNNVGSFDANGNCITASGCGITHNFTVSTQGAIEPFAPGTRMEFEDEYMVGIDRDLGHGIIFSARYIDRRLKRIIEDTGGISPEAANAGIPQYYVIANVGSTSDLFVNPIEHLFTPIVDKNGNITNYPAACVASDGSVPYADINQQDTFGNVIGSACFNPTGANGQDPGLDSPDGVSDGFANPVRNYDAVEIEFNKSFSNNWMMRANWRIAKLYGNFEGALRNDNAQFDPGISSLYDFTTGEMNLLGDQFKPGVLNTDRLHIVNFYSAYVIPGGPFSGLTIGPGITLESGVPFNDLKAHPIYQNAGEIPVGGRGVLGRTPVTGQVNLHLDYPFKLSEHFNVVVGWDFFNIGNTRTLQYPNQNEDLSFGVPNADFKKPFAEGPTPTTDVYNPTFQAPFSMRGMVRLEF